MPSPRGKQVPAESKPTNLDSKSTCASVAIDVPMVDGPMLNNKHFEIAKKYGMTDEELRQSYLAFNSQDTDHSGYINLNELRALLTLVSGKELSDEEFNETANKYDKDGDHLIDFMEFLEAFCKTPAYRLKNLEAMMDSLSKDIRLALDKEQKTVEWKAYHAGCSLEALKCHLYAESAVMASLLQLPATILMIVSFTVAMLLHTRVTEAHASDFSIKFDIIENANFAFSGNVPLETGRMGHKGIHDVNSIADFWSWFRLGLVPLLWYEGWDLSEGSSNLAAMCMSAKDKIEAFGLDASVLAAGSLDQNTLQDGCEQLMGAFPEAPKAWFGTPRTPTYLYYRSVVAGVRLSQLRPEVVPCPEISKSYRTKLHTGECVSGNRGFWLTPETQDAFSEYWDKSQGAETVYLKSGLTQTEIRRQIQTLETNVWFTPHATSVRLTFTAYNPHIDAITATYIIFNPNRVGHIFKLVHSQTFFMNPYSSAWHFVPDVIWISLVFKMCLEEVLEMCRSCKRHGGFCGGLNNYIGVGNFVDWLNILMSLFIVGQWTIFLQHIEELKAILEKGSINVPGTFADDLTRDQFYEQVDAMVLFTEGRTFLLAVYPFIVIFRLFEAFSAQPRLALVTKTMTTAAVDLLHFGFVFLSVFLLFTVSAIALFGQQMEEFADFLIAADTCFHILLGDFDWEAMRRSGRFAAGVWFWLFMWMVEIVMFNMLLAIVTDIYTQVRGSISGEASTMWHQAHDLVRRQWQLVQGERVSLSYVLSCLESYPGDPSGILITVRSFMKLVPKLREGQASRLVTGAIEMQDSAESESTSLSKAVLAVSRMEVALQTVQESVDSSIHLSEMGTSFLKNEIRQLKVPAPDKEISFEHPLWVEGLTKQLCDIASQTDGLRRQQQVQQQQLDVIIAALKVQANGHKQEELQNRAVPPSSAFDSLCSVGARAPPQHLGVRPQPFSAN